MDINTMDINKTETHKIDKIGKINLIIGCMFSGKTSELIRECRRRLNINQKIIGINYSDDKRYTDEDYIVTHNLEKIKCIRTKYLKDVSQSEINKADFIFIDEGQFFPDLKEYVVKWCEDYNKIITIISLDGDFQRNLFGQIYSLIPYCDKITKLTALCKLCGDGTEALFTCRISKENEQIIIGTNNYIPMCRKHYLEHNKN
jgi:thymidine kinase